MIGSRPPITIVTMVITTNNTQYHRWKGKKLKKTLPPSIHVRPAISPDQNITFQQGEKRNTDAREDRVAGRWQSLWAGRGRGQHGGKER